MRIELTAFSGDDFSYTLDLAAMTIAGSRYESGDAESCSVLYTLETTAIADAQPLRAALLETELLTLSAADCAAAKEDGTSFDGDFPQLVDNDGMRWSTQPGACKIALLGSPDMLALIDDAYFTAQPTAEEVDCDDE